MKKKNGKGFLWIIKNRPNYAAFTSKETLFTLSLTPKLLPIFHSHHSPDILNCTTKTTSNLFLPLSNRIIVYKWPRRRVRTRVFHVHGSSKSRLTSENRYHVESFTQRYFTFFTALPLSPARHLNYIFHRSYTISLNLTTSP